ncbi:hypothetical protein ACFLV5_00545 [Chloroflexota bacterium]
MVELKKLFERGRIGTLELKNRLVMSPMGTHTASEEGYVTQRMIDYYVARARGGVGLIISSATPPLPQARGPGRACLYDDKFIAASGKRPAEVSRLVGISLRTTRRYYADWKKLPDNMELRYHIAKSLRKNSEFSEDMIEIIASSLRMSEEEVEMRLQKPWGMKQLLMGNWPDYLDEEQQRQFEARLGAALRLVRFVENTGKEPSTQQVVSDGDLCASPLSTYSLPLPISLR